MMLKKEILGVHCFFQILATFFWSNSHVGFSYVSGMRKCDELENLPCSRGGVARKRLSDWRMAVPNIFLRVLKAQEPPS